MKDWWINWWPAAIGLFFFISFIITNIIADPSIPLRLCDAERTQAEAAIEQWWQPGIEHHRTTVLLNCLDAHE